MASSRWGVQDVALFLVLTILANALLLGAASQKEWVDTFYLALYVHLGFSLYLGAFECRRTVTWLMLIGGWAAMEVAGFAAFIIPTGQVGFWLATLPLIGPSLAMLLGRGAPAAWPVAALVLLGLDLCAMHAARWGSRSLGRRAVFLTAVLVAALALGLLAAALAPSRPATPPPFAIIPGWPLLPFFALLRAAPIKLVGIALAFAALLAPAIWPWAGAEKLRAGRAAWLWSGLSVAFAAAWLALGYLGAQPPTEAVLTATRGLAAFYFAFFVIPFVLRSWLAREQRLSPSNERRN